MWHCTMCDLGMIHSLRCILSSGQELGNFLPRNHSWTSVLLKITVVKSYVSGHKLFTAMNTGGRHGFPGTFLERSLLRLPPQGGL